MKGVEGAEGGGGNNEKRGQNRPHPLPHGPPPEAEEMEGDGWEGGESRV